MKQLGYWIYKDEHLCQVENTTVLCCTALCTHVIIMVLYIKTELDVQAVKGGKQTAQSSVRMHHL